MSNRNQEIAALKKDWAENPRWNGIKRGYSAEDVVRLRGSLKIETHEQRWAVWPRGAEGWKHFASLVKERDDLFIAQANAFLDGITQGAQTDLCTVEAALQTLKFNLAALESSRTGKAVEIS